ncbi:hypothetical protein GIB67_019409, partial [Kingdonia uniflora]
SYCLCRYFRIHKINHFGVPHKEYPAYLQVIKAKKGRRKEVTPMFIHILLPVHRHWIRT